MTKDLNVSVVDGTPIKRRDIDEFAKANFTKDPAVLAANLVDFMKTYNVQIEEEAGDVQ